MKIQLAVVTAAVTLLTIPARSADLQQTATVTQAEINAMTYKVNMAWQFFDSTWRKAFDKAGRTYPTPKLVPYRNISSCNEDGGNAFYSPADHVIRYDVVFLTCMMKGSAKALGTDGDYAPIVILAHELGHAVAHLTESNSSLSILRESLADCLAGVVTREAYFAKNLEAGDLEEGKWALMDGGDALGTSVFHPKAHGSGPSRVKAFMEGYNTGLKACDNGLAQKLAAIQPQTNRPASRSYTPTNYQTRY
jgi:predicted metalloprotease